MAVLNLKPHFLEYEVNIHEGYEDSRGDYHEAKTKWEGNIKCDAVPANGKANEITFEDGSVHSYTYTIYLDSNVREFQIGERIRLNLFGNTQRVFTVKGFQRYQLQSKLWV